LGREALLAVARALDPGFSEACLVQPRELSERELGERSLPIPAVPDSFKVVTRTLTAQELGAGCTAPPAGFSPSYNLNWTLTGKGGAVMEVNVNRWQGADQPPPRGYIDQSGLSWSDARGTSYAVHGFTTERGALAPDVVLQVAKSLDPELDVATLQKDGTAPMEPAPRPVPPR
jgi:hypothetical protein